MNLLQRGVLTLIKSALLNEQFSMPEEFELESVIDVANKHKILPIIYYGAVNCYGNSNPIVQKMFMDCCKYIVVSERQKFLLSELYTVFDNNNIDYMPLKGAFLKNIYPNSEMRRMGDADILIRENQSDIIKDLLSGLGYEYKYETDHEIVLNKQELVLELHKKLIPERDKEFYSYFKSGWDIAVQDGNNPNLYNLSPEAQFVFLFAHLAKHYRGGGIGLTHMIDLWVFKRVNFNFINEQAIEKELNKIYLCEFYLNVMNTLKVWFEDLESTEMTDFITNAIFESGVYGTYESKIVSYAAKGNKRKNRKGYNSVAKFFKTIFPSPESLSVKYPILKKNKYLLPFIWIIRWFHTLFFDFRKIKTKSDEIRMVSDEKLNDFEKKLRYVGIDYHFNGE